MTFSTFINSIPNCKTDRGEDLVEGGDFEEVPL